MFEIIVMMIAFIVVPVVIASVGIVLSAIALFTDKSDMMTMDYERDFNAMCY